MSQVDDESILSEATAEQAGGEGLKLVPVGESIRYRKRAQSAEKKVESLAEQLSQAESQACEMAEQLQGLQIEHKLMRKLAAVGVVDLETAILIAKARVEGGEKTDLDGVIEQLRKEKQYLFTDRTGAGSAAKRTAGAKDRMQNNRTVLEKAAKEAAVTGNRTDLQKYLKLRRNFV
jgi:hypothetical protein